MSTRGRKSGDWIHLFEKELEQSRQKEPLTQPLPASRELAKRYGVVHTSVFRHLQRLADAGRLWKAENGRFYFAEAQALVRKPRPVACLFRKIDNWSMLYQEFMEGISLGCEAEGIGSLLWHEELLVQQSDPGSPPTFADTSRQIPSLERFAASYGDDVGGVILDHVWTGDAIRQAFGDLRKPAVRFCHPSTKDLPALSPDYGAAAALALTHLSALGYRKIYPVRPFPYDPAIEFCLQALEESGRSSETSLQMEPVQSLGTAASRARLLGRLAKEDAGVALVFPEDNSAGLLWREWVSQASFRPGKIGVLSLQGTRAAAQSGISHVRTNYVELGRLAVRYCLKPGVSLTLTPPHFVPGESTRAR